MDIVLALAGVDKIYEFLGALVLIVAGTAIWLKAGQWWGMILIGGGLYYGYTLVQVFFG